MSFELFAAQHIAPATGGARRLGTVGSVIPHSHAQPWCRAGTPVTMAHAATSFVTSAPTRTSAYSPTVVPPRVVQLGAEGRPPFDQRGPVLVFALDGRPRVDHVGEHYRRPTEYVALQLHAFEHGDVVLNLHPVADAHALAANMFWPREHALPMRAPVITWVWCHTRVPVLNWMT